MNLTKTSLWILLSALLSAPCVVADGIEAAGDVLQYALPATAAGLTMVHSDWNGTLEFTGAFVLQGATVLVLKNAVHETRPNGQGS